ncbi:MAG: hypothetical protein M5R36_10935 [Deltaproteobacteria bacterium]|nr:hypothetical protein [Deltaproteobacteria bacterium]
MAHAVYSLPDSILEEFAEAYFELDSAQIEKACRSIVQQLGENEVSYILAGGIGHIQEQVLGEKEDLEEKYKSWRLECTAMTIFVSQVMLAYSKLPTGFRIVHDESSSKQEMLQGVLNWFRNGRKASVELPNKNVVYTGFKNLIPEVAFCNSKTTIIVRAADLFLAGCSRADRKSEKVRRAKITII